MPINRTLLSLYILTAILMIGYGAIFSLLAEIRDAFGFTSAGVGFIGAAAFAAGFVAQLFLSRFADAGYGKLMLQTGLVICIAGTAWMALADSLFEWIASRGALGFGSGLVRPAIRRYIIISNPQTAGRALGTLTAFETAGFLIGPVVAAALNATLGLSSNFIAMAILITCFAPFVINIDIPAATNPPDRRIMLTLIKRPAMQACIAMGIAFWITIGVFEAIWAIFLSDMGASQIFIAVTMSLFGIPMIFISPIAGEMAQHRGPLNVAVFSIAIAIGCMLLYGVMDNFWWLCLPLAIHAIAYAYTMPAIQLAVTQASGEDAVAAGQGLYGATSMAIGAITAALGGVLYQETGAAGLWWLSAAAMALLMLVAWIRGAALRQPYNLQAGA